MMDGIRQWLLGVLAAAMALSLLYALLPKGAVRGAARATGGLILLLVVLGPLAGLDLSDLALRYEDLSRDMERQAEAYRQEGQAQLELGIQQRTAAYISEKAAQLGLSCRPRVETAWRDGVPYPSGVTLDIAEKDALEIYVDGSSIILKKYRPSCIFCDGAKDVSVFHGKNVCAKCLRELREDA